MVAAAIVPAVVCVLALFGVGQILKPRLPKYSFQIVRFPLLQWINGQLKTKLGAGVRLQNDNYVPIDIHTLSFDLFYPDWQGELVHIGQIQDRNQQQEDLQQTKSKHVMQQQSIASSDAATTTIAATSSSKNDTVNLFSKFAPKNNKPALWSLLPRQLFEVRDEVFMEHYNVQDMGVLSSLSWDLVRKRGKLEIPAGGVIHIKANKKLPLTMSMICENALDAWTLVIQGIDCEIFSMEIGWSDMTIAAERLRTKMLQDDVNKGSDEELSDKVRKDDATSLPAQVTNGKESSSMEVAASEATAAA